ncbi:MAG: beta-lactamase family protein [Candidatus Aminicenantes bacterium]|nr:beta-lactamase family protein [Candidatus Aminicenantes bacterium]MDH5384324.1 beta-lactamase family protein [Candidatus Aminicenantes bacterium]
MRVIAKILMCLIVLFLVSCQNQFSHLPSAKPESVGMSSVRLQLLDDIIQEAIDRKDFPGADLLVARKGKIVWRKAYGNRQWVPELAPMDISMIFDMASITKPVATATSIMILAERGRLRLWNKVKDYVPEFVDYVDEEEKAEEDVYIWHLLTHTSGLPPFVTTEEVKDKYGESVALESMVEHIAQMEKLSPPGKEFLYSDLGYILLSYIIKEVSGKTVAEFAEENIFRPLNMNHTLFTPPEDLYLRCVPTEVVDGKPLVGIVHDPRARLMGGVSGHAGLFSTADDLAIFAQMMLNGGEFKGVRVLSPLAVERIREVYRIVDFAGRGFGWDLDSSFSTNQGDLFGPNAFGHTGYTGTSIIIDPDTETFVIFLTNRAHPDDKGEIVSMRSRVANVAASSIIKK